MQTMAGLSRSGSIDPSDRPYGQPVGDYPKSYTVPEGELAAILDLQMTYEDAFSQHDGYFRGRYVERSRTQRDGRTVVIVQELGMGWAVELTLDASGDVIAAVPLQREQARELDNPPRA